MVNAMLGLADPIEVPNIRTLDEFRRWRHSDGVPEKLKAHFFAGTLWIEPMSEEFFTHGQVKAAILAALFTLAVRERSGFAAPDGTLLTNDDVDLATCPDALFISHQSLESGRVRFRAGARGVATEAVGTPDVVVEVVSRSSVDKDTERLPEQYFLAGVPELWRVDARGEEVEFRIFTRGATEYHSHPGEWQHSPTFGRRFRLTRDEHQPGFHYYLFEADPA